MTAISHVSGQPIDWGAAGAQAVIGAVTAGFGEGAGGDLAHAAEGDAAKVAEEDAAGQADRTVADDLGGDSCPLNSFTAATPVATPRGEVAIGTLQVGDPVLAYNPATGKVQAEPVQHVFVHHDTNLMDVTIVPVTRQQATSHTADQRTTTSEAVAANHAPRPPPSALGTPETLHTTTEHPFLTADRGFVGAQKYVCYN